VQAYAIGGRNASGAGGGKRLDAAEKRLVPDYPPRHRVIQAKGANQERSKIMATVAYVLTALKPGVDPEDYERFEREVDYPFSEKMKTIVSYRTHRLTDATALIDGGPWNYIERIEVTDRAAYEAEITAVAKELINTLHEKYLDESKTKFIWSKRIDP
jgi:hypothetical protein